MENIRKSSLLRGISYVLIPIIVFVLILCVVNEVLIRQYGNIGNKEEYLKTDQFAEGYYISVISNVSDIREIEYENSSGIEIYNTTRNYYKKIEDQNIYYEGSKETRVGYINKGINYIIKDKNTGKVYTNIQITDLNKQIQDLKNASVYWYYENGEIKTSIDKINQNNVVYNYGITYDDYDIYSSFNIDNMVEYILKDPTYAIYLKLYDISQFLNNKLSYIIPISTILLTVIIIYLIWSIGHVKGKDGITLGSIDKISYEIIIMITWFIIGLLICVVGGTSSINSQIPVDFVQSAYIVSYLGIYVCLLIDVVTTIRRIKAKEFWHSFLVYKIWNKIKQKIDEYGGKTKSTRKLTFFYLMFLVAFIILINCATSFVGLVLLVAFLVWVYIKLLEYNKKLNKIQLALEDIYEGKDTVYLDENELKGVLKRMAKYINDIAGGFSNAIEQSLKSERLKTELITNVSHDIKTPLTSIINYVDLLKKEEFENKQVEQYIAILDNKSQRLKKLIEDLVEASKVQSGNVKLNIEDINLKELLNQTTGEFEDRFEKKNLKIELSVPTDDVIIKADNRYMYRIIENLFSNITKYALENSRVYIELKRERGKVKLSIKNISSERLNISADELMQRFVRGDKSRHTEGSGLGISIAKSLTELQNGSFDIEIDGDLFKVILEW